MLVIHFIYDCLAGVDLYYVHSLPFSGDNELYIAGGDHFGASVCSMYKWSPEDNHFEDMAIMQIARKQSVALFCFLKVSVSCCISTASRYVKSVGRMFLEMNNLFLTPKYKYLSVCI